MKARRKSRRARRRQRRWISEKWHQHPMHFPPPVRSMTGSLEGGLSGSPKTLPSTADGGRRPCGCPRLAGRVPAALLGPPPGRRSGPVTRKIGWRWGFCREKAGNAGNGRGKALKRRGKPARREGGRVLGGGGWRASSVGSIGAAGRDGAQLRLASERWRKALCGKGIAPENGALAVRANSCFAQELRKNAFDAETVRKINGMARRAGLV